jgi:hypothetical protein
LKPVFTFQVQGLEPGGFKLWVNWIQLVPPHQHVHVMHDEQRANRARGDIRTRNIFLHRKPPGKILTDPQCSGASAFESKGLMTQGAFQGFKG